MLSWNSRSVAVIAERELYSWGLSGTDGCCCARIIVWLTHFEFVKFYSGILWLESFVIKAFSLSVNL